jgi:hAT family C-terminal dimerisation region
MFLLRPPTSAARFLNSNSSIFPAWPSHVGPYTERAKGALARPLEKKTPPLASGDLTGPVSVVEAEFERWKKKWSQVPLAECQKSTLEAMNSCTSVSFPNIVRLLHIHANLPVSSCSCERSVSCLRVLKTYLRSTISEDCLNLTFLICLPGSQTI